MVWFANKGQIAQLICTLVALALAAYKAFPDMAANSYFSIGAFIFYLLVGAVLVVPLRLVGKRTNEQRAGQIPEGKLRQGVTSTLMVTGYVIGQERDFIQGVVSMTQFVESASRPTDRSQAVKIVASQERAAHAEMVVKALRVSGVKLMVNEQNASYIFPAQVEHGSVLLRVRPSLYPGNMFIMNLYNALSHVGLVVVTKDFPDSETFNYIQIEIGGGL